MSDEPNKRLTELTILELTRRVNEQDDRWSRIVTYAQSTQNAAAHVGSVFFKTTWRPVLTAYYEAVAAKHAPTAQVSSPVIRWLLDLMSSRIYPAARSAGFPEASFLFPDVTRVQSGHPATVTGAEAEAPALGMKKWGILAALFGAGYVFGVRSLKKKHEELRLYASAIGREAGIRAGMTPTQRIRAWDALYAKYGLQLHRGELIPHRASRDKR